jgi:thioredoxin reductase
MYKWIIIGGGIHGCTAANFLSENVSPAEMKIIDPHKGPMALWKKRTEYIGMEFLRSPSVHHTDKDAFSLQKFAGDRSDPKNFYGKYKRPNLHVFNEHALKTFYSNGLERSWEQGTVEQVYKESNGWTVETAEGKVFSIRKCSNSSPAEQQSQYSEMGGKLKKSRADIYHIFEEHPPDLKEVSLPITVVGGGISAAHTAVKLAERYPGKVTLLKRHPFRIHKFDSDPGWLGPKFLSSFQRLNNYEERRRAVNEARYKGSLPKDIYYRLLRLQKQGKLVITDGEINKSTKSSDGKIILHLNDGERIHTKTVLLATGFVSSLEEVNWLQKLIQNEQLQCAKCGYPIVSSSLEWCSHLYVAGPLSELEVGPTAGNISGAQKAAERISAQTN